MRLFWLDLGLGLLDLRMENSPNVLPLRFSIGLIGGATARIGDPSGKNEERNLLSVEEVQKNKEQLTENLRALFENVADRANSLNFVGSEEYQKIKVNKLL